jgi:predicted transcriptional regulator
MEMMVHVLDALRKGADKPTRVMYKSNLSWSACQTFLSHLVERGFVKVVSDGPRKRYELTPSGAEVLSSFTMIAEAMAPEASPPR